MLKHNQEHIISSQEMMTCYYYCCYSFLPHAYRERASYVFFFFFFSPAQSAVSFHFFSTTCLPLRSPRVFIPGFFCGLSEPKVELRGTQFFQSLNPCPSFRGSAVQGTLCRTWLSQHPTGLCPELFLSERRTAPS